MHIWEAVFLCGLFKISFKYFVLISTKCVICISAKNMSGRPKIFNEKEVIEKATAVFWAKGYEATSADDLLAAMGIGKGSFYHTFKGGKSELFAKVLQQRSDKGMDVRRKEIVNAPHKIEYLKSMFFSILDQESDRVRNGCLMGNSLAELSNIDARLKKKAAELLVVLEVFFLEVLTEAQQLGEISADESPALLARSLLTFWNGLNISVRIYDDPLVLKPIIENQFSSLK